MDDSATIHDPSSNSSDWGRLALAVLAGIIAMIAGAWATRAVQYIGVYVPLLAGGFAGSAMSRVAGRHNTLMLIIAAALGFVGAVLSESLCYVGHDSTMQYFSELWTNGSSMDWLFRALSTGLCVWFARVDQFVPTRGAMPMVQCGGCGYEHEINAKFCPECGQAAR